MGSGSEWLNLEQLAAFIQSRGGRLQMAYSLWGLITTQFPYEVRDVYGRDVFEFRRSSEGEDEVSLASLRAAMEFIDPCWIYGYGRSQHRWLQEWLATFD